MNDTIKWLESPEGEAYSKLAHARISRGDFVSIYEYGLAIPRVWLWYISSEDAALECVSNSTVRMP
jgi:hypothetical protein